MSNNLKPFVKWTGGKTSELKIIKQYMPIYKGRYIEPFVGGGAVFFSIGNKKEKVINDKSQELINLYNSIKNNNTEFYTTLNTFANIWNNLQTHSQSVYNHFLKVYLYKYNELEEFIDVYVKNNKAVLINLLDNFQNEYSDVFIEEINKTLKRRFKRLKDIDIKKQNVSNDDIMDNIEVSFKSSFYMFIRYIYNKQNNLNLKQGVKDAIFYFIREYCYSSMFRYNKKGEFNVPYGGISYNKKNIKTKTDMVKSKKYDIYLQNTELYSLDFEDFFEIIQPNKEDFIFLDPPYDSTFSSYANMNFDKKDQKRLRDNLRQIDSKFMMIIKYTDYIYNLYKNEDYHILMFNKNYSVNFQNRNDRSVEHLIIKNY